MGEEVKVAAKEKTIKCTFCVERVHEDMDSISVPNAAAKSGRKGSTPFPMLGCGEHTESAHIG